MVFKMNLKADQRTDMVPNFSFMNASPLAFMIPQHDDENSFIISIEVNPIPFKNEGGTHDARLRYAEKTRLRSVALRKSCFV